MDKKPLISILMNCFNGEEFLKESIESVIEQTYKNWELIFWDNKSNDKSVEIASLYQDKRIFIFTNTYHTNLGKARQNAFKKVRGDYLAFLDVDDFWDKEKLSTQIREFRDKNIGISFTNSLYFSFKRKENLYRTNAKIEVNTKSLIIDYPLSLNSIIMDVNKLKLLKYDFDENYSHISDFDLVVRLSSISNVKYLNRVLSGWRIHRNNESFKKREIFNIEILKWCDFHLKNRYLSKYKTQIRELKTITLARERIMNFNLQFNPKFFKNIRLLNNSRNKLFLIFSLIPFLPFIIFKIKFLLYRLKWF